MSEDELGQNTKSMDVSPPGKGRVMLSTSRPVVPNTHGDDEATVDDARQGGILSKVGKTVNPLSSDIERSNPTEPTEDQATKQSGLTGDASSNDSYDDSDEATTSGSAQVDMMATQAAEKRKAKEQQAEEVKQQQELQAMIDSKQHHVEIYSNSANTKSWLLIIGLLVTVGLVVAVYYLLQRS